MRTKLLVAAVVGLSTLAVGLVYAFAAKPAPEQAGPAQAEGYVCPIRGEELPCPRCCPLSK